MAFFKPEEEEDESDSLSDAASFPTQEDLESIIVQPPESVPGDVEVRSVSSMELGISASFTYSSFRSTGSVGSWKDRVSSVGCGSVGGGGSSIGESETKSCFTEHEHPARVMITTFPTTMTNATFETAKSDVATVCSGSVMEDIDISSHGTAQSPSADGKVGRRKHERGVEFALETSTMFTHTSASFFSMHPLNKSLMAPSLLKSSPLQGPVASSLTVTSINILNDMGPPINRSLLERATGGLAGSYVASSLAGSVRSFVSSNGTPSRPGSAKSFGSANWLLIPSWR